MRRTRSPRTMSSLESTLRRTTSGRSRSSSLPTPTPGKKLMSWSRIHYCLRSTLAISVETPSMKNQPTFSTRWSPARMRASATISPRYRIASGTSLTALSRFMRRAWAPPSSPRGIICARCRVASARNPSKRLLEH